MQVTPSIGLLCALPKGPTFTFVSSVASILHPLRLSFAFSLSFSLTFTLPELALDPELILAFPFSFPCSLEELFRIAQSVLQDAIELGILPQKVLLVLIGSHVPDPWAITVACRCPIGSPGGNIPRAIL